jgi:hypothetical protein
LDVLYAVLMEGVDPEARARVNDALHAAPEPVAAGSAAERWAARMAAGRGVARVEAEGV